MGGPRMPEPPRLRARVVPARGHYCAYAGRGESCPGPAGCTSLATPHAGVATDLNGERDGYRCTRCGRWDRRAEGICHDAACFDLPPPRKPRWNPLLRRRV